MEKEIIQSSVATTPRSELGAIQEDHEIWEETDGAVDFKVTRHLLPGLGVEAIFLSISGPSAERMKIIKDFKAALGVPFEGDINMKDDRHIDFITWLA